MLPHPFRGSGIKEEYTVEEATYPAGCRLDFDGSGFDEALGECFKAERSLVTVFLTKTIELTLPFRNFFGV